MFVRGTWIEFREYSFEYIIFAYARTGVIRRYICPQIEENCNMLFSQIIHILSERIWLGARKNTVFISKCAIVLYLESTECTHWKILCSITLFIKDAIEQMKRIHIFLLWMMKYKLKNGQIWYHWHHNMSRHTLICYSYIHFVF